MHSRRIKNNWHVIKGQPLTELDKKVLYFQNKGHLVPSRKLIKTAEQIEGIRRSSVVNTGVLDLVANEVKAGMSPENAKISISWYMIIPFRTELFRRLLIMKDSLKASVLLLMKWSATAFPAKMRYWKKGILLM